MQCLGRGTDLFEVVCCDCGAGVCKVGIDGKAIITRFLQYTREASLNSYTRAVPRGHGCWRACLDRLRSLPKVLMSNPMFKSQANHLHVLSDSHAPSTPQPWVIRGTASRRLAQYRRFAPFSPSDGTDTDGPSRKNFSSPPPPSCQGARLSVSQGQAFGVFTGRS